MITVSDNNSQECTCHITSNKYPLDILSKKNNLVLLSGGIDSQALCLYLEKEGIEYETLFANYLYNSYDFSFAKQLGISHILNLDLHNLYFEQKIHLKYFKKYQCTSPQLAIHLHILKYALKKFSKYNILMPGHPIYKANGYVNLPDYTQLSYYRFCEKENKKNVYPYFFIDFEIANQIKKLKIHEKNNCNDYTKKFLLYEELGLNVKQQSNTKTGFEDYKIFLKETKSIIFDKHLRAPVAKYKHVNYIID